MQEVCCGYEKGSDAEMNGKPCKWGGRTEMSCEFANIEGRVPNDIDCAICIGNSYRHSAGGLSEILGAVGAGRGTRNFLVIVKSVHITDEQFVNLAKHLYPKRTEIVEARKGRKTAILVGSTVGLTKDVVDKMELEGCPKDIIEALRKQLAKSETGLV